jgi:hypothetical protein
VASPKPLTTPPIEPPRWLSLPSEYRRPFIASKGCRGQRNQPTADLRGLCAEILSHSNSTIRGCFSGTQTFFGNPTKPPIYGNGRPSAFVHRTRALRPVSDNHECGGQHSSPRNSSNPGRPILRNVFRIASPAPVKCVGCPARLRRWPLVRGLCRSAQLSELHPPQVQFRHFECGPRFGGNRRSHRQPVAQRFLARDSAPGPLSDRPRASPPIIVQTPTPPSAGTPRAKTRRHVIQPAH